MSKKTCRRDEKAYAQIREKGRAERSCRRLVFDRIENNFYQIQILDNDN